MIAVRKPSRKSYAMLSLVISGSVSPSASQPQPQELIQHFNRIASPHFALDKDRCVNSGLAVVRLSNLSAELRVCFTGIWIQCDHLAARVSLENRDDGFRSDAERSAYERILTKA